MVLHSRCQLTLILLDILTYIMSYAFLLTTSGEGNNERHNMMSRIDSTTFANEHESNHLFLGVKIADNFPP